MDHPLSGTSTFFSPPSLPPSLHSSLPPPFQTSLTYSLLLIPHLNIGTTSFGPDREQSFVVRLCSHRSRKQEDIHSPPLPPSLPSSSPQELPPSDLIENKVLLYAFAVIAQGNRNTYIHLLFLPPSFPLPHRKHLLRT